MGPGLCRLRLFVGFLVPFAFSEDGPKSTPAPDVFHNAGRVLAAEIALWLRLSERPSLFVYADFLVAICAPQLRILLSVTAGATTLKNTLLSDWGKEKGRSPHEGPGPVSTPLVLGFRVVNVGTRKPHHLRLTKP
jgi:hypothetical protein